MKTKVRKHKRSLGEVLPQAKDKIYNTNYVGSKQKLLAHIIKMTPSDVKSVYDGFTGSGVVAYEYKRRGYRVITNDIMEYPYQISKAIIENSYTKLSETDIAMLVHEDTRHPSFILDNFKSTFFTPSILNTIDNIRYNINKLKGHKKSLALVSLGRACVGIQPFGHFTVTKNAQTIKKYGKNHTQSKFIERFKKECRYMSSLVFDNGKANKAYHGDINKNSQKVTADLAYFDPPYITEFSGIDYESRFHFIEGLMIYWKGKKINHKAKTKKYFMRDVKLNKTSISPFFNRFLSYHKRFKYTMLSYRDHAYPRAKEIKNIYRDNNGNVKIFKRINYRYNIASTKGANANAKEYLFLSHRVK